MKIFNLWVILLLGLPACLEGEPPDAIPDSTGLLPHSSALVNVSCAISHSRDFLLEHSVTGILTEYDSSNREAYTQAVITPIHSYFEARGTDENLEALYEHLTSLEALGLTIESAWDETSLRQHVSEGLSLYFANQTDLDQIISRGFTDFRSRLDQNRVDLISELYALLANADQIDLPPLEAFQVSCEQVAPDFEDIPKVQLGYEVLSLVLLDSLVSMLLSAGSMAATSLGLSLGPVTGGLGVVAGLGVAIGIDLAAQELLETEFVAQFRQELSRMQSDLFEGTVESAGLIALGESHLDNVLANDSQAVRQLVDQLVQGDCR